MPTPGRNEPCPCGSGKKYKKCCLARDEAKQTTTSAKQPAPISRAWELDDENDLDQMSNKVVDLLDAKNFAEAERARDRLRARYPDTVDWIERTAMIQQARGDLPAAKHWWEKTHEFMRTNDGYDDEGREFVRDIITRLEARIAAATNQRS